MTRRRDLMIGGLALAAAVAAEALRPRRETNLLAGHGVAASIPKKFGPWISGDSDALVSPEQAGELAKSLYKEIVGRTYIDEVTGEGVMLLAAYGDTQSDLLQLHRPEICYPAVGFTINSSRDVVIPLGKAPALPARRLVASMADRDETILYWTRIGERFPRSGQEQRAARLENAMEGFVADGILMRCSALGDPDRAFRAVSRFVPQMLQAIPKARRSAFIGTQRAQDFV